MISAVKAKAKIMTAIIIQRMLNRSLGSRIGISR